MSTPLIDAIDSGDLDRVAKLLAAGADPNATRPSDYTPLQNAVEESQPPGELGALDVMVLLLRHGALVDGRDGPEDATPLLRAVQRNHIEAVRLLLAAGADPNVRDHEGDSPLRICLQKGYLEMARLLLLCGANKAIHAPDGGGPDMTALGNAAYFLNVDMVKLLLAFGADPNVLDNDRYTVFELLQIKERYANPPLDPASQARLREIRQLLGEPPA